MKVAKNKIKQSGRKTIIIWTMSLVVIMYSVFVFFPILYGLSTSFFNWNPFQSMFKFVGFDNYTYALKNPLFWKALGNTIYFTMGSLILTVGFGLLLAALIHSVKRGTSFYRGIYFLPVISSMVAVSMLWKFMYNYDNGFFNSVLMGMGLSKVPWLQNSAIALPAIMVVQAWKDIGYALVLILAGINSIDPSIFESAEIDGAGKFRRFISITIPLIKNSITILVITKLIDYMQVYTPIKFITEGGPGTDTTTMSFHIFEEAFTYYNFGSASAISFILFAIIFILSMIQLKFSKNN